PYCSHTLTSIQLHMNSTPLFSSNAPTTTEIYTLSLHDALPIYPTAATYTNSLEIDHMRAYGYAAEAPGDFEEDHLIAITGRLGGDRKSTRLNSSHLVISYAVFCLKKKKHRK